MIRGVIFDLDGTIYCGAKEVPGASSFVRFLRSRGIKCLFVTNRANRAPAEVAEHLRSYGVDCSEGEVLTSAQVAARFLRPGRAFCIGEYGLVSVLSSAGFVITDKAADYVVVSFDRSFSYEKLRTAARLIREGARFIATNLDAYIPLEDGIWPGAGSLAAAVEIASGARPLVMGKPEPMIFTMALEKMEVPAADVINIGDNLATDIAAGLRAGIRSVLILTGVSSRRDIDSASHKPTWTVENYDALLRIVCGENKLEIPSSGRPDIG